MAKCEPSSWHPYTRVQQWAEFMRTRVAQVQRVRLDNWNADIDWKSSSILDVKQAAEGMYSITLQASDPYSSANPGQYDQVETPRCLRARPCVSRREKGQTKHTTEKERFQKKCARAPPQLRVGAENKAGFVAIVSALLVKSPTWELFSIL